MRSMRSRNKCCSFSLLDGCFGKRSIGCLGAYSCILALYTMEKFKGNFKALFNVRNCLYKYKVKELYFEILVFATLMCNSFVSFSLGSVHIGNLTCHALR